MNNFCYKIEGDDLKESPVSRVKNIRNEVDAFKEILYELRRNRKDNILQ